MKQNKLFNLCLTPGAHVINESWKVAIGSCILYQCLINLDQLMNRELHWFMDDGAARKL